MLGGVTGLPATGSAVRSLTAAELRERICAPESALRLGGLPRATVGVALNSQLLNQSQLYPASLEIATLISSPQTKRGWTSSSFASCCVQPGAAIRRAINAARSFTRMATAPLRGSSSPR